MSDIDQKTDKVDDGVQMADATTEIFSLLEEVPGVGEVAAAGAGGFSAMHKVDEAFGITDKISDVMPGGQSTRAAQGNTPDVTGQDWHDEKLRVDSEQSIVNGSPMHHDQWQAEKCRLDHNIPFGEEGKAAMAQICSPYAN